MLFSIDSFGQITKKFSGELTYQVETIGETNTSKRTVLIYARDSMVRIISFDGVQKQELIKHLTYNKSIVLMEFNGKKYAVRTNEHLDTTKQKNYTVQTKGGKTKYLGMKMKRLIVDFKEPKITFTFLYFPEIDAKYANLFTDLPGLPTVFYLPGEDGMEKYTLIELKHSQPPLSLFMPPKDAQLITIEEFGKLLEK
ncbi:MAG: hypothetical protein RL264_2529 [Bacteroidota bacterium]